MSGIKSWKTRPIFISSTFRDMQAERDYLRDIVFPELDERLRSHRYHIEPIDLRWGVETVGISEQESKELLVLKVCLDEIERCRPFLIVLLGDRYGWVPPAERMEAAVKEKGFRTDIDNKSVTALEIEFGIFENPDQRKRSFFYFRNPLPYEKMQHETAALYNDAYGSGETAKTAAKKLKELKEQIETKIGPGRVRHYTVQWDNKTQRATGLEDFGKQVLEDLWSELKDEIKDKAVTRVPTWQETERSTLEEFIEERARDFTGRTELIRQLETNALIASESGNWGTIVVGDAGSGKSALFAKIAKDLESENCLVLSNAAGISVRSGNLVFMLARWIGELCVYLGIKDESADAEAPKERENPLNGDPADKSSLEYRQKLFAGLLSRASVTIRVVCLIDALNQFDNSPVAGHMTWLPELWPRNAYLIATSIPDMQSASIGKRQGIASVALPPFSEYEAENIIRTICNRYHKNIHSDIIDILTGKKNADGSLSCENPLWLTIALQELLLLDEDDFEKLADLSGNSEEKLHNLLKETALSLPASIAESYDFLLNRAERRFGEEYIKGLTCLIGVSRHGLRERDLKGILPGLSGMTWSDLHFASFRRYFRAHIVQRGGNGSWDFAHAQLRINVINRLKIKQGEYCGNHLQIAGYLESLPDDDPVRLSELMYHYIEADEKTRAARYYGHYSGNSDIDGATLALADTILNGSDKDPNPGLEWVLSLLNQQDISFEEKFYLSQNMMIFLLDPLKDKTDISTQISVLNGIKLVIEQAMTQPFQKFAYIRNLTICYNNLGNLHTKLGELQNAAEYHKRSYEFSEGVIKLFPDNIQFSRDFTICCSHLGDLYMKLGELNQSRTYYEKAYEINDGLSRQYPDNVQLSEDLSSCCFSLGKLYLQLDDARQAMFFLNKAFELSDGLVRNFPDNTEYQIIFAAICNGLGNLYEKTGDLDQSLSYFTNLKDICENLYRRFPDNVKSVEDLTNSYYCLGDLYLKLNDVQKAESFYLKSYDMAEDLIRRAPDNTDFISCLCICCDRLGKFYLGLGKMQKAAVYYHKALEISVDLVNRSPDSIVFTNYLSICYGSLSDLSIRLGDIQQAESYNQKSLELKESLVKLSDESMEYVREQAIGYDDLGDLCTKQGDLQQALTYYLKAHDIFEELFKKSPEIVKFTADLCINCDKLGNTYLRLGNLDRTAYYFRKSLEIKEGPAELSNDNLEYSRDLSVGYDNMGDLYLKLGNVPQAKEYFQKANAIFESISNRAPDIARYTRDLVASCGRLGNIFLDHGDAMQACPYYRRCVDLTEKLTGQIPDNADIAMDQVVSYYQLAQCMERLEDHSEANKYRELCKEALQKVKDRGMFINRSFDILLDLIENDDFGNEKEHAEVKLKNNYSNVPVSIPTPNPKYNAEEASRLNIQYLKALKEWEKLPWLKRIKVKKPERPKGI